MTSTHALVDAFSHGGHDLLDINGIYLDPISGLPGEPSIVRGRDDIIPSRPGRSRRNRQPDRREIAAVGWVCGTGASRAARRADYWANRLLLESWLSPLADDETSVTLPGGTVYVINSRLLGEIVYRQVTEDYATCAVVLESVDPDWVIDS